MKKKIFIFATAAALLGTSIVALAQRQIDPPYGGDGKSGGGGHEGQKAYCVGEGDGFCIQGNDGYKCFIDGLDNSNCCSGTIWM